MSTPDPTLKRIAITGSSGFYGSKLIEHLRTHAPHAKILGLDVVPPRAAADEFVKVDVRDPSLTDVLQKFKPDTVVHLAFIVNPTRDDRKMRDINVGGSQNVFRAVESVRPRRFLMASSATVFGGHADTPVPVDDRHPIVDKSSFQYAIDKTDLERMIVDFSQRNGDIAVSWTRPCIICGPGINNYLTRLILNLPFFAKLDGRDSPLQFVHQDDVAAATYEILRHSACGPFNIGPPDWMPLSMIARETGRPCFKLPFWMARAATTIWWNLRLPVFDFPPELHYYVRDPWVVAPNRLQNELGFQFQFTCLDTFRELYQASKKPRRVRV
ncbi:MAG: NAD-dependent epimerase/dehydratase family protein [Planctomycetales bacterium]|nr:NAD-dependent epimerase/dehydratase family protein [Planctomycetales bacterium]